MPYVSYEEIGKVASDGFYAALESFCIKNKLSVKKFVYLKQMIHSAVERGILLQESKHYEESLGKSQVPPIGVPTNFDCVKEPSPLNIDTSSVTEHLAELAHNQWSGWMGYLFSKSTLNEDGTVTIPKWAVDRWKRQGNTPYSELSEEEKQSDRNEASRMIDVFSRCQGER